jgi:hypothetical protein
MHHRLEGIALNVKNPPYSNRPTRSLPRSLGTLALLAFLFFTALAGQAQKLRFVQLTDAHIFDEGWLQSGATPYRDALDDRAALHWAIGEINRMATAGPAIDFVVYTGDLGLNNVELPPGGACHGLPFVAEPGLPPFTMELAVDELAIELDMLKVRTILFVAGNNDLMEEDPRDQGRYDCFMAALQEQGRALTPPLRIEVLRADHPLAYGGVRVAGIDSASFKRASNYEEFCAAPATATSAACPQPQLKSLQALLDSKRPAPLLLFTHIPDLIDPYRHNHAFDLSGDLRQTWEKQACDPRVLGIFAGHFHSSDRAIYGTNLGTRNWWVSSCVGQKTWVAPPLAMKHQRDDVPQARGLLLVTVDPSATPAISVQPEWYSTTGATATE